VIPKDYGWAPGVALSSPTGLNLAQPPQLKRLFNRIRPTVSITNTTGANVSPIVVTTAVPHFLTTGDQVTITRVKGNLAANGVFNVTVPPSSPKTFSLDNSTGNGAYTSGTGTVVLDQRGLTIDRPKQIGSLNELITFLQTSSTIPKPTGSIYLGAHASSGGQLGIKLFRSQQFDERRGRLTEYEELVEALRTTPAPPPLAKRTVKIPSALVGDPSSRPDLFVHIRGCDIGRSEPFMDKWKEALGTNAKTTASLHEHGVVDVSTAMDDEYGSWEYYLYAFTVRRPAPRPVSEDQPGKVTPIRSRDELVDAFREAKELEGDLVGDKYKFIDGTVVSDVVVGGQDLWSRWVPTDPDVFNNAKPESLRHNLTAAVGRRATIALQWRLVRLDQLGNKQFQLGPFNPGQAVPPENERLDRLRAGLQAMTEYTPEHPFPIYKRDGYATFEDFMDGYTWNVSNVSSLSGGRKQINIIGKRIVYIMFVPVSTPNPGPDPNTSNLLFNFFPNVGSPNPAVVEVRSDDPRFFAIL
jgi:hypothetical protein